MKILFLAEGDANTRDCWSGCAMGFVQALREQGVEVQAIDVEPGGWRKYFLAARTLTSDRSRWRWRFRMGEEAFRARTEEARRKVAALRGEWDVLIQAGATVLLPPSALQGRPMVVYCDANIRFALRGRPFSGVSSLALAEAEAVAVREGQVYERADRIWTWSEALAASFREDFGQPASKLATIGAGANLNPAGVVPPDGTGPAPPAPSVLFVGKDVARKGLDLLVEAFAEVRRRHPEATLHVVGAEPDWAMRPGVILHGFLSPSRGEDKARIERLYREATVFCMPSRYEPFGVVFVEAMLAGLPCIGTDRWAMPEIIQHEVTGWVVPDGDRGALASALDRALSEPEGSRRMGAAGRARALQHFTWERVANRAVRDLERVLGQTRREGNAV